jgi:hypothetical protein
LGEESYIHPSFIQDGRVGRLAWNPGAIYKGFNLGKALGGSGYCNCPKCGTTFGDVVIVSNGSSRNPLIFGYDPDPGGD